jgi:hypothetical protein
MGNLFGGPKTPPPPPVVRMPAATDPSILAAGQRARADVLRRTGRFSTILSDNLQSLTGMSGSSSGKLGG